MDRPHEKIVDSIYHIYHICSMVTGAHEKEVNWLPFLRVLALGVIKSPTLVLC